MFFATTAVKNRGWGRHSKFPQGKALLFSLLKKLKFQHLYLFFQDYSKTYCSFSFTSYAFSKVHFFIKHRQMNSTCRKFTLVFESIWVILKKPNCFSLFVIKKKGEKFISVLLSFVIIVLRCCVSFRAKYWIYLSKEKFKKNISEYGYTSYIF